MNHYIIYNSDKDCWYLDSRIKLSRSKFNSIALASEYWAKENNGKGLYFLKEEDGVIYLAEYDE